MQTSFNGSRLKTTLKMAISKLKFLQEKKLALGKQQRRQLADLLAAGKETSATIRVENIIRDDIYVELLEYLELYCELLLARLLLILDMLRADVDPGLQEAVALVIYSCSHVEVKEVASVGDMLKVRYGVEYTRRVLDTAAGVSDKVASRCGIEPPPLHLVVMYLTEIARAYEVPYSQDAAREADKGLAKLLESLANGKDGQLLEGQVLDKDPGTETTNVSDKLAKEQADGRVGRQAQPNEMSDFDKLKERFAALKR